MRLYNPDDRAPAVLLDAGAFRGPMTFRWDGCVP